MGMEYIKMNSPVGQLTLIASNKGLSAVLWESEKKNRVSIELGEKNPSNSFLIQAKSQLEEYFKGKRACFELDLDPVGSEFQIKVWKKLQKIPYGQTASYKDLAVSLGKPTAARAVGMANGKNPLSIVVPCHRVIGANGALTGYAGGLENKVRLLKLENTAF